MQSEAARKEQILANERYEKGLKHYKENNIVDALMEFEQARDLGHVEALVYIGLIWFNNKMPVDWQTEYSRYGDYGGKSDREIAFDCWREASLKGSERAKKLMKENAMQ